MRATLTNSRLKSARACQRLHRIEYVLGYRPRVSAETLRFGTLIHKGLEAWWRAQDGERLADALAVLSVAVTEMEGCDVFDLMKAQVMLTGYDARWEPSMEHYEVLGVEVEFETELRNPETGRASQNWVLGGKIDVLVRDLRDGLVYVVEHKTSSEDISPGSEYWRRLRMDSQVSVYFEGGRALGHEIAGCIYDVLGKPGLQPLKATPKEKRKYTQTVPPRLYANQRENDETPEEYRVRVAETVQEDLAKFFQRGPVARMESEMEEALFDIWQTAQQVREAELAGRAPRNPDACVRYNRTCAYFDVCTGLASLDDPTLFQKTSIHPELEGPKEVAQQ